MLLIHPGSARTSRATVTVPLDVLADHRGQTIVELNDTGNVRVLRNKKNAARIQSYVTDVIAAYDDTESPQPADTAPLARQTGWGRLVAPAQPAVAVGEGSVSLSSLFVLEETGTIGAVITARDCEAAPVLTDAAHRAQTTCCVPLPSPEGYSLDLLCAPFAAQGVLITGLEYEGFFRRVVSAPLTNWNPAQLPHLMIRPDLSLTLTAARTKTDAAGTPCIRIAYDPFTEYGRIWRADAVRLTEDGTAAAVQQNGFLYFPVAEGEPYTADQPISAVITLDFLTLDPTILSLE